MINGCYDFFVLFFKQLYCIQGLYFPYFSLSKMRYKLNLSLLRSKKNHDEFKSSQTKFLVLEWRKD